MNRLPPPDFDSLPDRIPSTEVARLFAIQPKSLTKYAAKGLIAPPVERGANSAWYAKKDVIDYWNYRQIKKAQGYIKEPSERQSGGVSPSNPPSNDIMPPIGGDLSTPASEAIAKAVAEGVRRGMEQAVPELIAEIKGLREEVSNLRAAVEGQSAVPSIEPSNFFARFFKSRK